MPDLKWPLRQFQRVLRTAKIHREQCRVPEFVQEHLTELPEHVCSDPVAHSVEQLRRLKCVTVVRYPLCQVKVASMLHGS